MKPAPTPDDPETILWTGSYSGKAMLGQWIAAGAASVVLPLIGVVIPGGPILWIAIGILLAAVWTVTIAQWAYRKLSIAYELTNQRLKHRSGILNRVNDRIELIDVDDVIYKQGPIQALVGVGAITLRSSDVSHPEFTLLGIENVKVVADQIDAARRTERRKRGIYVETV